MSDDYASQNRFSLAKTLTAGAALACLTVCVAAASPRIALVADPYDGTTTLPEQADAGDNAEALGRSLIRAITERQWDDADALIAAGADVNTALPHDGTPLIAAINEGSVRYAEKLIALGADVNADAHYDETPLISAVRNSGISMVRLLIDSGADVNQSATTEKGELRSPLGEANRLRRLQIAQILRDAGATE